MAEKKNILVVDDTPSNIKILNDMLKEEYRISAATSGKKALTIIEGDNPPDLVLLDVVMPEMDGFEVCKNIKSNDRIKTIPVIFITGEVGKDFQDRAKESGAEAMLKKPIDPDMVKKTIKEYLS